MRMWSEQSPWATKLSSFATAPCGPVGPVREWVTVRAWGEVKEWDKLQAKGLAGGDVISSLKIPEQSRATMTALATMIGAELILTDPIFPGLAISLLFGLGASTLLTVLAIPEIYVGMRGR